MTWFYELRRTVNRIGTPTYVTWQELEGQTGFRSVYGIDEQTRDRVMETRAVKDLGGVSVYSDMLFVDFDEDELTGPQDLSYKLSQQGVYFEVWSTGRRGCHFHIPIVPMIGTTVPQSQLAWVKQNVIGAWDDTLYRPTSIFRLPGTWHEKNPGHRKQLEQRSLCSGALLIPTIQAPPPVDLPPGLHDTEKNEAFFWQQVLVPKREPGRTNRVFYLGRLANECGVGYDDGLTAVRSWAATCCQPPLENEREIVRAFTSGYRR